MVVIHKEQFNILEICLISFRLGLGSLCNSYVYTVVSAAHDDKSSHEGLVLYVMVLDKQGMWLGTT